MRNKILGLHLLLIMVLLLVGLFFAEKNSNRVCGVAQYSEKQIDKLIDQKKEEDGFHDFLCFVGKPIPYDDGENILYISQNLESKYWQGRITTQEGEIFFLEDNNYENKIDFISNNERGKLYLIGPDFYETFEVCFSGMPVMNIDRDRDYVEFTCASTDKISCEEYVGNIEKRGGRSRRYDKKSYKLTFEDKHQLLDMRNDDDWILNALYDDMGLIHNAVSYEVWNQISSENNVPFDNTVRQEYVELLVDGEYRGVYGLTERIDASFVGLKGGDIMYKAFGWPDWEADYMDALECKYPKEETSEDIEYVKNDLKNFYTGQNDYDSLKESIYYENALDFQIFNQLIVGIDNTMKNSYLVYKQEDGVRKLAAIPWDCNATWGCHFKSYYAKHYIDETNLWSWQFRRLYEVDENRSLRDLRSEWLELRQSVITEENISSIARRQLDYLHSSGAYERNYNRWPYFPQEGDERRRVYEAWKDEYIFEFINGHINVLDKFYEQK